MTAVSQLIYITACALVALAAIAEDISRDLEEERKNAREMTDAMQHAQLLLSDMSNIFECDYSGYNVSARTTDSKTTYLVVIDANDDSCEDMVKALNDQGSKDDLAFVSERRLLKMKPMPSSEPGPFDEQLNRPMDYTLINEVDPPNDQ